MLLSYVVDDVFVPNSTSMRRNRKKFSLNKTSDDLIFCFIPSRDSISFHFVGSMNQDKNVSFFLRHRISTRIRLFPKNILHKRSYNNNSFFPRDFQLFLQHLCHLYFIFLKLETMFLKRIQQYTLLRRFFSNHISSTSIPQPQLFSLHASSSSSYPSSLTTKSSMRIFTTNGVE